MDQPQHRCYALAMPPHWTPIADPAAYVRTILGAEAPDIPPDLITAAPWVEATLKVDKIQVDARMIASHDRDPVHIRRRDIFMARIRTHEPIPPLIVLGRQYLLVDGYARYRALTSLGIGELCVLHQVFETWANA